MKKRFYHPPYPLFVLLAFFFVCSSHAYAQDINLDSLKKAALEQIKTDGEQHEKHIYDSSERFFNAKFYSDQPFAADKFSGKTISPSLIDSLKKDKDFWYASAVEKFKVKQKAYLQFADSVKRVNADNPEPASKPDESFEDDSPRIINIGPGLQYLLLGAAILIFLGALVYFLSSNKVGFFAPSNKNIDDQPEETDLGENIFILPYQDLLNKAIKDKNYRLATRILYLQTLKLLSENGIITFKPDSTNIHYLMQLNKTAYYDDFFKVTRHYEYVWYGKFDVTPEMYEKISKDFSTMQKKIIPSYE
ncbi:hypothetical protein [Pinibacter aurantiacus]|uniref:DUF4129 domain-containing protein n=1 Tax=Pinibacter aurantiacus TaxID=2851599 RepID=A0A9E2SAA5_9BACT|nr:hypothetical protein [Pinibacter aurantiacus]MBV4359346.1 hypothetical protein [Pinibacter aurantiacus]